MLHLAEMPDSSYVRLFTNFTAFRNFTFITGKDSSRMRTACFSDSERGGGSLQKSSGQRPLADLREGARDARPPAGPNSFIFMQFSTKYLQNNRILGVGALPSEKSWIPSEKSWIRHWVCPSINRYYILSNSFNTPNVPWTQIFSNSYWF